jgi:hypothetical protein
VEYHRVKACTATTIVIQGKKERRTAGHQPVESFFNNVSVDGKIKLACSGAVGGNLLPNFQHLFLELPRDEDQV